MGPAMKTNHHLFPLFACWLCLSGGCPSRPSPCPVDDRKPLGYDTASLVCVCHVLAYAHSLWVKRSQSSLCPMNNVVVSPNCALFARVTLWDCSGASAPGRGGYYFPFWAWGVSQFDQAILLTRHISVPVVSIGNRIHALCQ